MHEARRPTHAEGRHNGHITQLHLPPPHHLDNSQLVGPTPGDTDLLTHRPVSCSKVNTTQGEPHNPQTLAISRPQDIQPACYTQEDNNAGGAASHAQHAPPGGLIELCPSIGYSSGLDSRISAGPRPRGANTHDAEGMEPTNDCTPPQLASILKDESADHHHLGTYAQASSATPIGLPQANSTPAPCRNPPYHAWPYPAPWMDADTAALYDSARMAVLEDEPLPRLDHTTSLVIQAWESAATGHPSDEMVLRGIKRGFSTQYCGPPVLTPTAAYNHQSAVNYPAHIDAYVEKEIAEAALSGPYDKPPFTPWFVSSPMMTRDKSGGDERRVIVDLSFPEGGINQFIAPHLFDGQDAIHNLPTITSAVSTIAITPPGEIHMAVIDLSRAYRQFPVTPLDWPLLGISWRERWSFDRRLPFGCRMSSYIMQSIAEFITRALDVKRVRAYMYLDDILIISPTRIIGDRDFQTVITLLGELGLTVATHKLQPPSPVVTWLGINIDVDANQLSIPTSKLGQIKDCMARAAERSYISKKQLQRLIGLANHLAKVVRAARTFICRLLAALRASSTDRIRVTEGIKADLAWYARYLSTFNGRAIIPAERVVLRIWADACLKGAGASDGDRYYEHSFTHAFSAAHHIAQLEGLNCLAAIRVLVGKAQAGGTIEVMCDNRPSVDAFTSGRARDEVLAASARALWYHAASVDVDIRFTHVPGEEMALPDALSRASVDAAGRARADHLIRKLSLRRVRVRGADFNYKSFL